MKRKVLVINEPNYTNITETITNIAVEMLAEKGLEAVVVTAPDIVELPTMLKYYLKASELRTLENMFSGYIILGCSEFGAEIETLKRERMIIGEIDNLKLQYTLALSCGIFCPKDSAHGLEWGKSVAKNAVDRCVSLLEVKKNLGL